MHRPILLFTLSSLLVAGVAWAQTGRVAIKQAPPASSVPSLETQVADLKTELAATKAQLASLKADVKVLSEVVAQHAPAIDNTAGRHVAMCLSRGANGALTKTGACGPL
jgi:septal ring factor EnvC (AmiA/AmiB activator)